MITLSFAELSAMAPCRLGERRSWFGTSGRKRLNVVQALNAGASFEDILWVAMKLGRKDLCVRFALLCAQRTVYLNSAPSVQKALDATQKWLDNPSDKTAYAAYAAAYAAYAANAAYAAAYAANAAAYAANAAYAAAYAVNAASNAAYAADYAVNAANVAANTAKTKEKAEQRKILIQIMSSSSKRSDL